MFHYTTTFFKNLDLGQGFSRLTAQKSGGSLVALRLPPGRIAAIRPLQVIT